MVRYTNFKMLAITKRQKISCYNTTLTITQMQTTIILHEVITQKYLTYTLTTNCQSDTAE